MTRLPGLRLHALLLHLIRIVLPVVHLLAHHVLPRLSRLAGHHAHLLLHAHLVRPLRQLRAHAHLVWSPAGHGIAHSVYKGRN